MNARAQRNLAATAQKVLEDLVLSGIRKFKHLFKKVKGIAVGGGVSMNSRMISVIQKECNCHVHVPDAPGDEGIVMGGAWFARPPRMVNKGNCVGTPRERQLLTYVGLPTQHMGRRKISASHKADDVRNPMEVAKLLAYGYTHSLACQAPFQVPAFQEQAAQFLMQGK